MKKQNKTKQDKFDFFQLVNGFRSLSFDSSGPGLALAECHNAVYLLSSCWPEREKTGGTVIWMPSTKPYLHSTILNTPHTGDCPSV